MRYAPALVISILMHAGVLGGMYFWRYSTETPRPKSVVETVFMEERPQEEFTQEMMVDTTASQTLSVTAGGAVTGQLGATSGNPTPTQNIEKSDALKQPQINVTQFASVSLPGIGDVNLDLGEGEVSGETGARVEGYGAAMHRMTHELRRMMRQQPLLVVWIFDATKSLEDDRKEISANFSKIYEELEIARQQAESKKERFHAIETLICGFGQGLIKITPKPTIDLKEIQQAILKIPEDKSGEEMVFTSLRTILDEYGKQARATDRKLAIVLLTDEAGSDEELLEEVVDRAKLYKTPIYFLGREAVFGYPTAKMEYKHPETGESYWLDIKRGPETAMPECLQYNGFGGRWDSSSSGFASYPQARVVQESGGIFFMLQSKEASLANSAQRLERKFDDIRMKQYEPDLVSVRDYVAERDQSDFRKAIWQVILRLNPHLDRELGIKDDLPIGLAEFKKQGAEQFQRGVRALELMNAAIAELEKRRPDRDEEADARWRAAYDLVYAQLLAYRVRVFQYLLALDNHLKADPKPKNPKSNHWVRRYAPKLIEPTEQQIKAANVDIKQLEAQRKQALAMYNQIIKDHPDTPWAQRAAQEKAWGFGIELREHYWDPRRWDPAVLAKLPKL
jgi:hypothetical protein